MCAVRIPWNYDKEKEAEKERIRQRWALARMAAPRTPMYVPIPCPTESHRSVNNFQIICIIHTYVYDVISLTAHTPSSSSPPQTRCVRSRYLNYDRYYPRSSSPVRASSSLSGRGFRESFSFRSDSSHESKRRSPMWTTNQRQCLNETMPVETNSGKRLQTRRATAPPTGLMRSPCRPSSPDKVNLESYSHNRS